MNVCPMPQVSRYVMPALSTWNLEVTFYDKANFTKRSRVTTAITFPQFCTW